MEASRASRAATRDHSLAATSAAPSASVNCDLCGWNMPLPDHCREQGAVLGLLVCTACIEDQLEARVQ